MSGRYFLDTNVLVYCFDRAQVTKRKKARILVENALSGAGTISFQIVQEFLNVARKQFGTPMTADQATAYLDGVLLPLCSVHSDPDLYREALGVRSRCKFSLYDSLVVAGALRSRCKTLYSEDLQHGQTISALTVRNPFL